MDIFTTAILDSVCYIFLISLLEMSVSRKPEKKEKDEEEENRALLCTSYSHELYVRMKPEWYCNHVSLI